MRMPFDQLSSVKPTLNWLLIALTLLVLVVLLAHFVILPLAQRIRRELADYLGRLIDRHSTNHRDRDHQLENMALEFKNNLGLKLLNDSNRRLFDRAIAELRTNLTRLTETFDKCGQALLELKRELSVDFLSNLLQPVNTSAIALPSSDKVQASVERHRVARTQLVVFSVLLTGLLLVNTGMLSQIIRDLGFIPQSYSFVGVPLFFLFAFLLTLIEAGVGAIHDASRKRPGDDEKFSIIPAVIFFLATVIACVEGFFYSQVAPNKDALIEFPFIGYQMKQSQLFFLWGFALVMVLFLLGSGWYRALDTVKRGSALSEVSTRLQDLANKRHAHVSGLQQTTTALEKARTLTDEINRMTDSATPQTRAFHSQIDEFLKGIASLQETPPAWTRTAEEDLSLGDIHQLAQQAGASICLMLIAGAALAFSFYRCVLYLQPELAPALALALVPGVAAMFIGSGFLVRGGEKIVSGGVQHVVSAPMLSRAFGAILTALLITAHATVLWRVRMPRILAYFWLVNLVLGLFLEAVAYHLYPLLNISRLWIRRVWNLLASAFERVERTVIRGLLAFSIVFEYIALFFAAPLGVALRRPVE